MERINPPQITIRLVGQFDQSRHFEDYLRGTSDAPKIGMRGAVIPTSSLEAKLASSAVKVLNPDKAIDITKTNEERIKYCLAHHLDPYLTANGKHLYRAITYEDGLLTVRYGEEIPQELVALSPEETIGQQVASLYLGVSVSEIKEAIERGEMPTKRKGAAGRLKLEDVNRYKSMKNKE
ncbi:MAG: hypothetical protein AABX70_07015, partial [Nanoarchaeota archaeon]